MEFLFFFLDDEHKLFNKNRLLELLGRSLPTHIYIMVNYILIFINFIVYLSNFNFCFLFTAKITNCGNVKIFILMLNIK